MRSIPPKKRFVYPAAFLLPVMLYVVVMIAAKIVPFGEHNFLVWDANNQSSAFLAYWQRVLSHHESPLYSFSLAYGGSMIGLIGTDLSSPLNLWFLLFPPERMALAYTLLVVIKIGLCGLTFMVYLRKAHHAPSIGLLFSTSYALMGFIVVYGFILKWLDALILLPLVALGIRRICEGKRPFVYIVSLGMLLLSFYYIGYMVCVFAVLYFIYCMMIKGPLARRGALMAAGRFAFGSLLAGGLAAGILIPVALTMVKGYGAPEESMLSLQAMFSFRDMATKLYTGATGLDQIRWGFPNIYIGIPLLVIACLYFLNPKIKLRARLWSLALVAVFVLSLRIRVFYYFWHGFDQPDYFPARFSFLFSFVLIEIAYLGFAHIRDFSKRRLIGSAAGLSAAFIALTLVLFIREIPAYLMLETILMDVVFFVASAIALAGIASHRRLFIAGLCAMQAVCLIANAYFGFHRTDFVTAVSTSGYAEEIAYEQALVDRVQEEDTGLYRMETNFRRSENDALTFGYAGLTHFSSVFDKDFYAFSEQIGVYLSFHCIQYANGIGPVLDSLLGVKYLLCKDENTLQPPPDEYRVLWKQDDVTAYENPFALPLAILAPQSGGVTLGDDPFVNQNLLLSDLTGTQITAYVPMTDIVTEEGNGVADYTFPVLADAPLYMHSSGRMYRLNGVEISDSYLMNGIIRLPSPDQDTTYHLFMMRPLGIYLAYFNMTELKRSHEILTQYPVTVTRISDAHLVLQAYVPADRTQLLLTVPFDAGWHAWVDDVRIETTSRYGEFLAIDLPAGSHEITLRFMPQGLVAGLAVSGASLLIVFGWTLLARRGKREKHNRKA